ncbi:MAG TPA: pitrilysin family protein [Kofleriaceae bacterium]|nr:pitrilysin family protein [Kofleriaceae bacterium]
MLGTILTAGLALAPIAASGQPKPAPTPPTTPPAKTGAGSGSAATPPATPTPSPNKSKTIAKLPTIEQFTLGNGMRVAVLANDAAPVAAVQVWYHAGSKDEPRDRRGSAHMFEHMMFKGTKYVRSEAHAQYINGLGGYVNAQTDEDATHYINTLPSDYLEFAIKLEAERMRNLLFRPDMIKVEKEVVKEEIRQQENSPITKGFLRFLEVAFAKHPYAWTAGGNLKDLDATTPEDLRKFYDAYYQPNNALLVVVGKTTAADVKTLAEKYFGTIPKGPEAPRPARDAQEPPQTSKRREVVEPGQIGLTLVGYHIPPAKEKDIYALQVASIILGTGESSRLKTKLKSIDPKTKRPFALDGGVEAVVREDPGLIVALGAYLDPSQGDGVEIAIAGEIDKLAKAGPTADELRKAKNQVQSGFTFSLENAQGLATAIGRSWILVGEPSAFLRDVDEIEKVTAADVSRAIKKYMTPDKATTVVIPPRGAPSAPPAKPDGKPDGKTDGKTSPKTEPKPAPKTEPKKDK